MESDLKRPASAGSSVLDEPPERKARKDDTMELSTPTWALEMVATVSALEGRRAHVVELFGPG